MNFLVTGASGLLGSEIVKILASRNIRYAALDRQAFLLASSIDCSKMLDCFDIIIHAAANTDVEQCELDPEKCYYDNCYFTEKLFRHAYKRNAKFVFLSSAGVYGEKKTTPYHEYDEAYPTTVHHKSKYMAEKIVLNNSKSLVVRTGWLFGGDFENKKNFVINRLKEVHKNKGKISANVSQIGTPTYAKDCADKLLELIFNDCAGIYNLVNTGKATRFEYVKKIIELSGAPFEVSAVDGNSFKRHAAVSNNESAVSYKIRFDGQNEMRPWQEALESYMFDYGLVGCLTQKGNSSQEVVLEFLKGV